MTCKNKTLIRSGSTVAVAAMLLVVPALFFATYAGQPAEAAGGTAAASDSMTMDGSPTMGNNDGIMPMLANKNYSSFRGQISNVQLDKGGQPEWIQSGIWVLRISQEDKDAASPQYGFTARIMMVKPDGLASHTHAIYGIKVTGHDVNGTMHSLSGTANVGMPSGTVADVPIRINLINDAVIALWIGPDKVDGHFGSNPIYGTLAPARSAAKMEMDQMMMMATEVPKLTETSLPVTIPLTKGFVDGAEVFYISTEASDKDLADHLTEFTGFRVAYAPSLARTPQSALANIYAFSNGIEGSGPLGFQPSVADSKPGDSQYSPLWRINMVEWMEGATPRILMSDEEIASAQAAGEVGITFTQLVVNCPFVKWDGGSLQVRSNATLADDSPYGGGQLLAIDLEKMQATFVAHRGFAPDGSTIYYIATDASVMEVADALGVIHVNKTGSTLLTGAASDLWVFTNGIKGTGPMGFQASIASGDIGDSLYSPMWRIIATTWNDAGSARFLTSSMQVSEGVQSGALVTDIAGVIVNCPIVEIK